MLTDGAVLNAGLMVACAGQAAPQARHLQQAAPGPDSEVGTRSLTPVEQQQQDYYDYDLPEKQSWPEAHGHACPEG